MKTLITTMVLAAASAVVLAQNTPVGLWKTLDDDGKTEKSLVRVTESGGTLSGTIEKLFDPAQQDAKCDKCADERKNMPVKGMTIIRNAKPDAGDSWTGGEILDPNTGKVFKLRLKPIDGGQKMEMRGYNGPLHRTQTWVRVE
jgi:uncharacterized protein (DUF2147 family)